MGNIHSEQDNYQMYDEKQNKFESLSDPKYLKYVEQNTKFNKRIKSDDCCGICLESLTNINVCITKCGHHFHTSCIIRSSQTCPTCRQSLLVAK